jgi:hypothetical protein
MKTVSPVDTTRRKFLLSAASAAGALAVADAASAQDPRVVLDAAVLNYLARVQDVQAELYREGMNEILASSSRRRQFDSYGGQSTIDTLLAFQQQEASQAATLRDLAARLGATPLPPCGVNFPRFPSVAEFLATILSIENLAVSAYLGILPLVRNAAVESAVASMSSVQSRHAAFIGMLNGQSPAPEPADTPRSRDDILRALDPYIGECASQ